MSDIDDQIRDYYEACCLDGHRANAILQAGRQCSRSCHIMRWSIGLAAALIVLSLILQFAFPRTVGEDAPSRIATEVASAHAKLLDPEFITADYQELQQQLERIDYSILPSSDFLREKYALVGARYCSIHTCLAVQIRLRDKVTGQPVTLYIAKLDPVLEKARPDTRVIEGVRVQVWKDEQRFFAMATHPDRPGEQSLPTVEIKVRSDLI